MHLDEIFSQFQNVQHGLCFGISNINNSLCKVWDVFPYSELNIRNYKKSTEILSMTNL